MQERHHSEDHNHCTASTLGETMVMKKAEVKTHTVAKTKHCTASTLGEQVDMSKAKSMQPKKVSTGQAPQQQPTPLQTNL